MVKLRRLRQHAPPETDRTQVFGIDVEVVEFDDAVYYVPDYGRHRYVAQQILKHKYAENNLHALVATVGATYAGSMVHAGTFFGDMLPSFSKKINGTVYAFEPVLENYLLARAASEVNDLRNVTLVHAGLGPDARIAHVDVGNSTTHGGGGSKIKHAAAVGARRSQPVALTAIDAIE